MIRALFSGAAAVAILCGLGGWALGQAPGGAIAIASGESDPPPPPEFKVLKLRPAPEPYPALLYRLDPEIRNQVTGNALTLYYRAFSPEWMNFRLSDKDYWKKEEEWLNCPLEKLPKDADFRRQGFLAEIERATDRSYIDWEMVERAKQSGIYLLIPDIQSMRMLARMQSLKIRYELKEKEFDQAVRSLRTLITMGRNTAKGPTLIQGLVGVAITAIAFGRLEEAIQQPDFPNMFWALEALPANIVDYRSAMDGEKILIENLFPGIRDILYSRKLKALSQSELEAMVENFRKAGLTDSNQGEKNQWEKLFNKSALGVMVAAGYPEGKKRLIKFGFKENEVQELPQLQVVLMAEVLLYDEIYDSLVKWLNVPYFASKNSFKAMDDRLKELSRGQGSFMGAPVGVVSRLLLPAITKVMESKIRIERQLAMLKVVEGIRLHAAKTGAWPKSIEEIKEVPLPLDPTTGKAFSYTHQGDFAMLEAGVISNSDRKEFYRYKLELTPITPR